MKNEAAELGPKQYDWWPDWRGESVAIVASGPSMKKVDVSVLKDRIHVIAIKRTVELCPWAEVCYGCDAPWWLHENGLPNFHGIKLFHGAQAANRWPDLRKVDIDIKANTVLVDKPLRIGNGGNSGFQALNLAIQFGAKDIILLGFDCATPNQHDLHWYGRNQWANANNPMQSNFNTWLKGFDSAKKDIDRLGVEVVNCSAVSSINTFRKAPLNETMKEWGL